MKINFLFLIFLLFLLPHCGSINNKKIFKPVKDETKKRINIMPSWKAKPTAFPDINKEPINIDDAILIGIEQNPSLQAHFETLGISKAKLIQSGFYTNPNLIALFKIPKNDASFSTKIEISASFTLSDLWQIPLRKKVTQKELTTKTYSIINEILHLKKHVQLRYLNCVYKKEWLNITHEVVQTLNETKNQIEYRYQFGYQNQHDIFLIASKLAQWNAMIIDAQAELSKAYIQLQEIIGTPISTKSFILTDTFYTPNYDYNLKKLINVATQSHPLILIEQAKINTAQSKIKYEKSRILDDVKIGITYERDFEPKASGIGPFFNVNIPIFNTNYGNIQAAQFEKKQAQQELISQQRLIIANLSHQFALYQSYIKQIEQYQAYVLPPLIEALEFSKEFFNKMQMSMLIYLETYLELHMLRLQLLTLFYDASVQYAELEFSMGSN